MLQDDHSSSESIVSIALTSAKSETPSNVTKLAHQGKVSDVDDDATASRSSTGNGCDYGTITSTGSDFQYHQQETNPNNSSSSTKKQFDWNYVYDEVV